MAHRILISRAIVQEIEAIAVAAFPLEACGLLIADQAMPDKITRHIQADNTHPSPSTHFEIDPVLLLRTHRECRASGQVIRGVWHSHPSGHAAPSATDHAKAFEPDYIWLITGVTGDGALLQATETALFQAPEGPDQPFQPQKFDMID